MFTLSAHVEDLKLESINGEYKDFFVTEVLNGYREYAKYAEVPVLPFLYFHGEQPFIDSFIDTFSILRASYEKEHYPEFDWNNATDEEKDTMEEKINDEYVGQETDLLGDIERVFDHQQLFHIIVDTVSDCEGEYHVVHHFNSPIQEVW